MSLRSLLDMSASRDLVKDEISEERLLKNLDAIRKEIAFYREYPDLFIDDIKGPDCKFKFRFTQRIFLRSIMRHRYVYCVFTRGEHEACVPFNCWKPLIYRAISREDIY